MNGDMKKERMKAQSANAGRRRRKRAGKRTLHYMLFLVICITIGAVLSLTVFFKIESINVTGTDKYDPANIQETSGIIIGENLFRFSRSDVIEKILGAYPYIESVEVNLRIPSAVDIVLTQSIPAGAVKEGDEYILITREGKILERGILYIPEDIPLIKGLHTGGTAPGQYIGTWEKQQAAEDETPEQADARKEADEKSEQESKSVQESLIMVEYLFKAMEEIGFKDITNVDITDRLNMKIMYENRLMLELGSEADLVYKLEMVRTIIQDKLEPDARGTLHAENAKNKKVVFSPADDYSEGGGRDIDDETPKSEAEDQALMIDEAEPSGDDGG